MFCQFMTKNAPACFIKHNTTEFEACEACVFALSNTTVQRTRLFEKIILQHITIGLSSFQLLTAFAYQVYVYILFWFLQNMSNLTIWLNNTTKQQDDVLKVLTILHSFP